MENNDSVCFIAKINKLSLIEGAEKIELATIEGWTSIVQKDIHKEGDLILCITTDALIPEELANKWGVINYLRKGSRVRTIRLKGVYSECILIPLNDLQLAFKERMSVGFIDEGEDFMNKLNICKYEPPVKHVQLANGKKLKYKDNPNFHIYYKFPNQKNVPNMFNENDDVVITRKIHGTNARYGIVKKSKLFILDRIKKFFGNKWIEYEYAYGSHNVEKGSDSQGFYSTDIWKEIADKYDIKNKLWFLVKNCPEFKDGVTIYGEIYGDGIQGEKYNYNLKTKEIQIFDIQLNSEYVDHYSFCSLNHAYLRSLPMVNELYIGKWSKEIVEKHTLNQFIEVTKIPHEGCVIKCISGDRSKIYKSINPEYHTYSDKNNIEDLQAH